MAPPTTSASVGSTSRYMYTTSFPQPQALLVAPALSVSHTHTHALAQNIGKAHINPYMWAMFYLPLAAVFGVSCWCLFSIRGTVRRGLPHTARRRMLAFRTTLRYVVGFFPYWTLTAAVLVAYVFVRTSDTPIKGLHVAFAAFFGAEDVVMLAVWLWTNDFTEARRAHARAQARNSECGCVCVCNTARGVCECNACHATLG